MLTPVLIQLAAPPRQIGTPVTIPHCESGNCSTMHWQSGNAVQPAHERVLFSMFPSQL